MMVGLFALLQRLQPASIDSYEAISKRPVPVGVIVSTSKKQSLENSVELPVQPKLSSVMEDPVLFYSIATQSSAHKLNDLFRPEQQRAFENSLTENDHLRLVKLKSRFFVSAAPQPDLSAENGSEYYLTFSRTPNESQKKSLERQGIRLIEHITRTVWRTVVDDGRVLDRFDSILGAEPVWPVDKWSPDLWAHYLSAEAPDKPVEAVVAFSEKTSWEEAEAVLNAAGASVLESDFQYGSKLRVQTGFDGLLALCGSARVCSAELPPPPKTTDNLNAAKLSNVDDIQPAPYGLTGTNIHIMVRDGGGIALHPDYNGRVTAVESLAVHYHSTHVAGTIAGNGSGNSAAKGMAPQAQLYSYDYNGSDAAELIDAKNSYEARLSNHSYGYVIGWEGTTWNSNTNLFGSYTTDTRDWDAVVYDENIYVFKSAGNDRNDTGTGHPHDGTLYGDDYYDCMETVSCAKNIITIGAVDAAGAMSSFSNFGPTDDGRIKPDIVADGVDLLSTWTNSNYAAMSGTSMSSPVACGAAALLLEQYRALHSNAWPSAAYLKGLMIHTATDLGRLGPDYAFGWGLVDAQAAIDLILDDAASNSRVINNSIIENQTNHHPIVLSGDPKDFRVTLCWTDPEGNPVATDALVNDLDVVLVSPDGAVTNSPYVMPFALDGSSPTNLATTGTNRWDNVEQIDVSSATNGLWDIVVVGETVPVGPQSYVVFVDGGETLQPKIALNQSSFQLAAGVWESGQVELVVSNVGSASLTYSITDNTHTGQYTWADSDMAGGPSYDWIDITAVGGYGTLPDDGISVLFNIGFDFPFYEQTFSQFSIGANGAIAFSVDGLSYLNTALPSAQASPQSLFAFWDDLNMDTNSAGGGLVYFHGTTERLVVSYENVLRWGTTNPQTFQAILYPDGRVVYQYKDMNGDLSSCTVGLQENGTAGRSTQVAYNGAYVTNNLAVEFNSPPSSWLSYSAASGTVESGATTSVRVTGSASNLTAGTYLATVTVMSNDPVTPTVDLPLRFEVTVPDQDGDSLPDWWETLYFGGATNANPDAISSNGVNTLLEAYVAGLNPTNPTSVFVMTQLGSDAGDLDRYVLQWDALDGRVYTIYWATNLFSSFDLLTNGIIGGAFTDSVHGANNDGFYRVEVDLAP